MIDDFKILIQRKFNARNALDNKDLAGIFSELHDHLVEEGGAAIADAFVPSVPSVSFGPTPGAPVIPLLPLYTAWAAANSAEIAAYNALGDHVTQMNYRINLTLYWIGAIGSAREVRIYSPSAHFDQKIRITMARSTMSYGTTFNLPFTSTTGIPTVPADLVVEFSFGVPLVVIDLDFVGETTHGVRIES